MTAKKENLAAAALKAKEIERIEKEMDCIELSLLAATTVSEWDKHVRMYNALGIDLARLKGEPVIAQYEFDYY